MKETPSNPEQVVPILQIADFLLVPIQIDLDDKTVSRLQEQLLKEIERTRAKAVILDVRTVEIIDSYISYTLSETAAMARLMGCRTILCGIRPAVALTLAQMGIVLEELNIARDLEHALVLASSS
ncbi:anti-sigma-factor antagonist [Ammonifex degensii KC4]|uniref:Anti-sigma-factor antagonist n=1 Tax=Ammonifex degensii (strain DSM 10501 / KC4) TaxID=429009 RepID=C9R9B9_AMMDK|nr:STAS domain-containing protein [Ammonifex degensii]ACX52898.1 anti-sigma-factor antagonist [Ammonifex degensii KC4]